MNKPAAPTAAIDSPAASIHGTVKGGYFAIYNATINLYATGTGGYGVGSTLLATTTSAANGTWSFTKQAGTGTSAGNTSTWICPTSGNPQIYITSVGGNTQGTGVTTTNNASAALIADIGLCSTITSSTQVNLNELTTAATVFAMAQYINPGTTPGTLTIGTSNTTQGTTGINNAAASIANLASISAGSAVTSNTYNGVNNATGVTVTATPETAKLETIADILVSCINQVSNSNNNCADLFASASPPPNASFTSQPSASFGTPQDTIQAAYYMAVNPIDAGTFTSCFNGGTTKLGCLFGLSSSSAPFQTALSSAPTDWTIGVTYSSSSNCTNGAPFILGLNKAGVDASGNLWFVSGASSNANWGELSPIGVPLNCGGANINGRGLTIDPTGNVWVSFNNTVLTDSVQEVRADTGAEVSWAPTVIPYSIVSDGNGNIFSVNTAAGASLYEYAAPGTSYSPVAPSLLVTGIYPSSTTTNVGYIGADSTGRILMTSSSITSGGVGEVYTGPAATTATITGYSATTTAVTFTTSAAPGFTTTQAVSVSGFVPASIALTGYSSTASAATFNTGSTAPFTVGQDVTIAGFVTTNGAKFNGKGGNVTAVTSTSFTIASTVGAFAQTSDTGTASAAGSGYNGGHAVTAVGATSFTIAFAGAALPSTTEAGSAISYTSSRSVVATSPANSNYGAAIDSGNNVYSGTTCCSAPVAPAYKNLIKTTPDNAGSGTSVGTTSYFAGDIGTRSVVLDGAANQWFGNELPATAGGAYSVGEVAWSGTTPTALSPSGTTPGACTTSGCFAGGGFQKAGFLESNDMEIDPSGNVWVMNTGSGSTIVYTGTSITEIVGAAVPVVTPLSVGAKNGALATKP